MPMPKPNPDQIIAKEVAKGMVEDVLPELKKRSHEVLVYYRINPDSIPVLLDRVLIIFGADKAAVDYTVIKDSDKTKTVNYCNPDFKRELLEVVDELMKDDT